MIIGIDGTPSFTERAIKRYTIELINNLIEIDNENLYKIFYIAYHKKYLKQINLPSKENVKKIITRLPGRVLNFLWNNFNLPKIEYFTSNLDVFHATDLVPPPVKNNKIILTLHGLIPLMVPHLFGKKYVNNYLCNLKIAMERVPFFIAVSETTKKEFLQYHKIEENRVAVIPLGVSDGFKEIEDKRKIRNYLRDKLKIDRPYIFYIGAVEKRKNIDGVIEGFNILCKNKNREYLLVLGGPPGYGYEEFINKVKGYKLQDKVIFTGIVEETDLPLLYNCASLFIFISFCEGWASPPLEAMKCGIPTIVSNVSSLPETVGDASILVNPTDYEEIADAMYKGLTDDSLRKNLIKKGLIWASQFTWEKCAEQTLKFYEEVVRY